MPHAAVRSKNRIGKTENGNGNPEYCALLRCTRSDQGLLRSRSIFRPCPCLRCASCPPWAKTPETRLSRPQTPIIPRALPRRVHPKSTLTTTDVHGLLPLLAWLWLLLPYPSTIDYTHRDGSRCLVLNSRHPISSCQRSHRREQP